MTNRYRFIGLVINLRAERYDFRRSAEDGAQTALGRLYRMVEFNLAFELAMA